MMDLTRFLSDFTSLLCALYIIPLVNGFNIDVHAPVVKFGPANSFFGYSVAQHFKGDTPVILAGAPRAESGQPSTKQAGAVFSCPLTIAPTNGSSSTGWCTKEQVEYRVYDDPESLPTGSPSNPFLEPPSLIDGREIPREGKDGQLLGSVISSSGGRNSRVVVCAPLLRYHNRSSYLDGSCYVLNEQLKQTSVIHTCRTLDHGDRHNNYGACMEGFSANVHQPSDTVITGLPGARKWTGGVSVQMYPNNPFDITRNRWTMGVDDDDDGITSVLAAHDYLGFSVKVGRFGFWYEDAENLTIVSGATRFEQTGAVLFMPFRKKYDNSESMLELKLLEDHFLIKGTHLGSAFGYSIEVMDINADGFDDLLVGAPFHYVEDDDGVWGGAVFVYFSRGVPQPRDKNDQVFHPPVQLRAKGAHGQFGLSITTVGDIDKDPFGLNDFAVGAPFANKGKGTVFIFHGSNTWETLNPEPAQVIDAEQLVDFPTTGPSGGELLSFGFALSGGADLDGNGYPDLLVGAVQSDAAILLRTRPVVNVVTSAVDVSEEVDKDRRDAGCPSDAQTCFTFRTVLSLRGNLEDENSVKLVDLTRDVFRCTLEVIPFTPGVNPRARLVQHETGDNRKYSWNCGRGIHQRQQEQQHRIYIPSSNQDWLNPLKFRTSVEILNRRTPPRPRVGEPLANLNAYPVLNKDGAEEEFTVAFNKKCGSDKLCQSDIRLECTIPNLALQDGVYVKHVSTDRTIDLLFQVENVGERAYESTMYVEYDSNELDVPELKKYGEKGGINLGEYKDDMVTVLLGNPLEANARLTFNLSFALARVKSEGLGKALAFKAIVNSTSEELTPENNEWSTEVRVIKEAELELIGVSDPDTVYYGGDVTGEAAMELEEDIGPMVKHRYTVTNHGPWSVSDVTVTIDWPYEVQSVFQRGKWALYLLELPTISTPKLEGGVDYRQCTVDLPLEHINPIPVKLNTAYSVAPPTGRITRPKREINDFSEGSSQRSSTNVRYERELRIKPKLVTETTGEQVYVVDVSCATAREFTNGVDGQRTAKCFTITCKFDYIEPNVASIIDVRARLWNSTFVEDYTDVEYVMITSEGHLFTNPDHGIKEDTKNNWATVMTRAYPDLPKIADTAPVPWWAIAVAVALGLLILLVIVLICWRCGFFKRKRPAQPILYQAEYHHTQEEWS